MNLLQLSQNLNDDGEREWTSMLHTGLCDQSLSPLAIGLLPPNCPTEIVELITDLNENTSQRHVILTKLCNAVLSSFNPDTRAHYLWYLHFTVTVLLLKDLPLSFYILQGHLLTKCFSPITRIWDANPVTMDYFASHLHELMENDKNLIFVTSQMENRSDFGFYLSLHMLWKSIYRCIDEEKAMFRLYPPSNLIAVTNKISLKKLDKDFDTIFSFILLHSKIASLIFQSKRRSPPHKCFDEFFVYDIGLIETLKEFLETLLTQAESMWRRDNENLNYLTMVEYLQIDISEFDTLHKKLQE